MSFFYSASVIGYPCITLALISTLTKRVGVPSDAPIISLNSITFYGFLLVASLPFSQTSNSRSFTSMFGRYFAGPDLVEVIKSVSEEFFLAMCL